MIGLNIFYFIKSWYNFAYKCTIFQTEFTNRDSEISQQTYLNPSPLQYKLQ